DVSPIGFNVRTRFKLRQGGSLEQREIPRVELLVGAEINGLAGANLFGIDPGELPVALALGEVEIHRPEFVVGKLFRDQVAGKIYYGIQMFGRTRVPVGPGYSERIQIAEKGFESLLRVGPEAHSCGNRAVYGAAVEIRNENDLIDRKVFCLKKPRQEVGKQKSPCISDRKR